MEHPAGKFLEGHAKYDPIDGYDFYHNVEGLYEIMDDYAKLLNRELLEALQWIEHHALQDGLTKESIKAVAQKAIAKAK